MIIPGAVLIASNLVVADFTDRYLSYCAPAAALLIADALVRLAGRRRWILAVVTIGVVGFASESYFSFRADAVFEERQRLVGD